MSHDNRPHTADSNSNGSNGSGNHHFHRNRRHTGHHDNNHNANNNRFRAQPSDQNEESFYHNNNSEDNQSTSPSSHNQGSQAQGPGIPPGQRDEIDDKLTNEIMEQQEQVKALKKNLENAYSNGDEDQAANLATRVARAHKLLNELNNKREEYRKFKKEFSFAKEVIISCFNNVQSAMENGHVTIQTTKLKLFNLFNHSPIAFNNNNIPIANPVNNNNHNHISLNDLLSSSKKVLRNTSLMLENQILSLDKIDCNFTTVKNSFYLLNNQQPQQQQGVSSQDQQRSEGQPLMEFSPPQAPASFSPDNQNYNNSIQNLISLLDNVNEKSIVELKLQRKEFVQSIQRLLTEVDTFISDINQVETFFLKLKP